MILCCMNEYYVGNQINYLFEVAMCYLRRHALRWQLTLIKEDLEVVDCMKWRGVLREFYNHKKTWGEGHVSEGIGFFPENNITHVADRANEITFECLNSPVQSQPLSLYRQKHWRLSTSLSQHLSRKDSFRDIGFPSTGHLGFHSLQNSKETNNWN